jgi:hypothetical protein
LIGFELPGRNSGGFTPHRPRKAPLRHWQSPDFAVAPNSRIFSATGAKVLRRLEIAAVHGKLPLVDIFYTSAAFEAEAPPRKQAEKI